MPRPETHYSGRGSLLTARVSGGNHINHTAQSRTMFGLSLPLLNINCGFIKYGPLSPSPGDKAQGSDKSRGGKRHPSSLSLPRWRLAMETCTDTASSRTLPSHWGPAVSKQGGREAAAEGPRESQEARSPQHLYHTLLPTWMTCVSPVWPPTGRSAQHGAGLHL